MEKAALGVIPRREAHLDPPAGNYFESWQHAPRFREWAPSIDAVSMRRKAVAMLNQVERVEMVHPMERMPPSDKNTVWVYSKGQAPYQFRMWMDPCSPHEWPYNLQALRGSADYDDILAWYLGRYHEFSRNELEALLRLLMQHVPGREISVAVYHDIDTCHRHLWFTVWGFSADHWEDASALMLAFEAHWASVPELSRLLWTVDVSARPGSFEAREQPGRNLKNRPRLARCIDEGIG